MTVIAIVAGEASGDILGASLIDALKHYYPEAEFIGVGGPLMIQSGFQSYYPMDMLSVMGLEALKRLPKLLKLRKTLYERICAKQVDVFIGIDAPDFNLTLERKLKQAGMKTVHYVSPSVWAWRQWRVKKMQHSMDLMLTLFPFEVEFYAHHHIPAHFVGHPLADSIPMHPDKREARDQLSLRHDQNLIALLPGSRMGELERLSDVFIETARYYYRQKPGVGFMVPFANAKTQAYFESRVQALAPDLDILCIPGQSRLAMQAADAVLLASGTAALEAMLLKRPMVVAYKLSSLTYWILKRFKILKVSHYSLPNLLAGEPIVEEYVQQQVNAENLGNALLRLQQHGESQEAMLQGFEEIHMSLRQDASRQAALAIHKLITNGEIDV